MKDVKFDEQLEDCLYTFFSEIIDSNKSISIKHENAVYKSIWDFWECEL